MWKSPGLFLLLAALPFAAIADLHVYSKVTTSSGETFNVEQWIASDKGTRRVGQQVYVADLDKRQLMLIDHDQRTVTHYDLIDPEPLGTYDFNIEPTDRFDTLGEWKVEEFRVTNPNRPNVEYFVWSTRNLEGVNTQYYYNFVRRLPSGDDFTAALQEIYGFPVRIVTVIKTDQGEERVESTVSILENAAAPPGTYEAPKGYRRQ